MLNLCFAAVTDAADAEGQCLKAEVEILRSTAKQNAAMLAELEQQSQTALSPEAAANSPQPSSLCSNDFVTREVYLYPAAHILAAVKISY